MSIIKPGQGVICIKKSSQKGKKWFKKGEFYVCRFQDCLIDETGDPLHHIGTKKWFEIHFVKVTDRLLKELIEKRKIN